MQHPALEPKGDRSLLYAVSLLWSDSITRLPSYESLIFLHIVLRQLSQSQQKAELYIANYLRLQKPSHSQTWLFFQYFNFPKFSVFTECDFGARQTLMLSGPGTVGLLPLVATAATQLHWALCLGTFMAWPFQSFQFSKRNLPFSFYPWDECPFCSWTHF